MPVVKPIFEGKFTSEFIISVLDKKINEEKIPANELFILPSVYINDEREWGTAKTKETSTVIYGKKPEKTYVNDYGHYILIWGTYGNRYKVADPSRGLKQISSKVLNNATGGRNIHYYSISPL